MKSINAEKVYAAVIALVVIIIAGTLIGNAVSSVYRAIYNVGSYETSELTSNTKAFERVAESLLRVYGEEKERNGEIEYIEVDHYTDNTWRIVCVTDSESDEKYEIFREMTDEEASDYEDIIASFCGDAYVGELRFSVRVFSDRAVFSKGLPHAVIYMKSGLRPSYVFSPDEEEKMFVDRLSLRLFQVVKKV